MRVDGANALSPFLLYLYRTFARLLPPTRFFGFKRRLLILAGAKIGGDVRCVSSASFFLTGSLSIGEGTWIGHEVLVVGGDAAVTIGESCDVAPRVTFVTGSHQISEDGSRVAGAGYSLPITIGDGSWICTGATILGGTTIGERSIIAAGAVVKGNFPPRSLIGGVPARLIRDLSRSMLGTGCDE